MVDFPKGICPILATPFTDAGAVDYDGMKNLVNWLIERKVAAITMFGIGSEYYKLSDFERNEMIDVVVKEAKGRVPIIASVTKHATELAVEDAVYAEKNGVDMLMLLPPFFLSPGPDALIYHIEQVCEAVKIPIVLQYAPEQTGVRISSEIFIELARKYPQVSYKIECKPPGKVITSLVEGSGGGVTIYVGNAGFQWLEGLQRGAVGVMPGSSMVEVYEEIYKAFVAGDFDTAERVHNELLPLLNCIRQNVEQLIQSEKTILKWRGVIASDHCRRPTFQPDAVIEGDFRRYYAAVEKYLY